MSNSPEHPLSGRTFERTARKLRGYSVVVEPVDAFIQHYRDNELRYGSLKNEVEFTLRHISDMCGVKPHSISGRVKELGSAVEKIERKAYADPLRQLNDVVGCRIVCTFLSDLEKITKTLPDHFQVIESDDRIEHGDVAEFGYMSRHFVCQLRQEHAGPRYDQIKNLTFEIQCRTMLMDAWANVSHQLAYKGAASIPAHLTRDFNALSGLFYVADKHFELFFQSAVASEELVIDRAKAGELEANDEVNLETIRGLFAELYPDREQATPAAISEFVEEIVPLDYASVGPLRLQLQRGHESALKYEKEIRRGAKFVDVGLARTALALADPNYLEFKYATGSTETEKDAFRHLFAPFQLRSSDNADIPGEH